MTKRELIDDPNSCLNRSVDDEPVFLICARDVLAPGVVNEWAERAREADVNADKVQGAFRDAAAMERWQRLHGSKLPD